MASSSCTSSCPLMQCASMVSSSVAPSWPVASAYPQISLVGCRVINSIILYVGLLLLMFTAEVHAVSSLGHELSGIFVQNNLVWVPCYLYSANMLHRILCSIYMYIYVVYIYICSIYIYFIYISNVAYIFIYIYISRYIP